MIKTISLGDYLISEHLMKDKNGEFIDKKSQRIIFFEDNSAMQKILKYNVYTHEILNRKIFNKNRLSNTEHDKLFKQLFINHFYDKSIKFQTIEIFATKVTSVFFMTQDLLENYYTNIEKYYANHTQFDNTSIGNSITDNRSINATLPQSEINLSLDDDDLQYADDNTISKNRTNNNNENKGHAKAFSSSSLLSLQNDNTLESILKKFEKECFSYIF